MEKMKFLLGANSIEVVTRLAISAATLFHARRHRYHGFGELGFGGGGGCLCEPSSMPW